MTRVLIVDDIPQNLYLLETIMKGNGFESTKATNGVEALEEAMRSPPDLIIADILMPIMDGFKLCQKWKMNDRLKQIPFIFYTATYTSPKDEQFALSLGAERYVIKPQKPDVLIRIVREVLEEAIKKSFSPGEKPVETVEILQEYNEVLFHKLERKMKQLENGIALREATEQALRESEERFRKIFEYGAIGIAIVGPDHRFIRVNDGYCKMLGYTEEEMLQIDILEITYPEDRQSDIYNIKRLVAGEIPVYATENRYIKKDGTIAWTSIRTSTICNQDGQLIFFIVFASDITEQKKMQENEKIALQQIERNLEQLATLNDQIRNPLSVIVALLTLQERTKTTDQIMEAVRSIDDLVKRLDKGWEESEKVREFLERNNQISRRT
jgi:PAS domain S-box-containing protein